MKLGTCHWFILLMQEVQSEVINTLVKCLLSSRYLCFNQ